MKKTLPILLLTFFLFSFQAFSQNFWKTYTRGGGYIDDYFNNLVVQDSTVYLSTDKDFSVFKNGTFTTYDASNSSLDSRGYSLKVYKDTVYLLSSSFLNNRKFFQFVNGNFTDYTDSVITDDLTGFVITSSGEVWISSKWGISRKKGNTFSIDSSKTNYMLAVNGGDSIFMAQYQSKTITVFDGTNWSEFNSPEKTPNRGIEIISSLSDGGVLLFIRKAGNFADYFIYTSTKDTTFEKSPIPIHKDHTSLWLFDRDRKGNLWYNWYDYKSKLYRESTNHIDSFYTGIPNVVYHMRFNNNKIYLATDAGLVIADDTIKPLRQFDSLKTSKLKVYISQNGHLFGREGSINVNKRGGFEFPLNSNKHLLNGSGLWFSGTNSNNQEHFSAQAETTYDYYNTFKAGTYNDNLLAYRNTILHLTKKEIDFHLSNYTDPNYIMPSSIKDWYAVNNVELNERNDLAPFVDANNNGCYDPENGDYPFILGDEAIYVITSENHISEYSDLYTPRLMGLEVHSMIYLFNQPNIDYLENSIFVKHYIINRSNNNYKNVKIGVVNDFEIGEGQNDAFGTETASNVVFGYNGSTDDTVYTASKIPFVGMKFINTQITGSMGYSGNHIINNQMSPPNSLLRKSRAMNLKWHDGTPLSFGGSGYDTSSTNPTNFHFPGDPNKTNEWSFLNPGINYDSNKTGAGVIQLAIAELGSFNKGERKTIDLVYGVGHDSANTNYLNNYDLLINNLNKAARFQQGVESLAPQFVYANCTVGTGKEIGDEQKENKLLIYPNPNSGVFNVLSSNKILEVYVYDLQGKMVQQFEFETRAILQKINLDSELKNGLYLVRAVFQNGEQEGQQLLLQR